MVQNDFETPAFECFSGEHHVPQRHGAVQKFFFPVATEQSWMMENQWLESAQEMVMHDT